MKLFKQHPFGLDIGDTTLKLVSLNNRREIVSHNIVKLPEGWIEKGVIKEKPSVSKAIKELIEGAKGKKVQTNQVVACLPEPKTFIKIFEFPSTIKKTEINELVLEQIPINFPLRWDEVYMDWRIINWKNREKENLKVLVGVAPRDIVAQYVDMLQGLDLSVSGLQIEATAIVNALHKTRSFSLGRKKAVSSVGLYIDLGYNRSSIIVVDNGIIQFSLSMKHSTKALYKAIAGKQGKDPTEVKKKLLECGLDKAKCAQEYPYMDKHYSLISKEILKAMKFYNQISSRKQFELILTGGTALTKGLPEFFKQKLGVDARLGNPFANIRFRKSETRQRPEDWNVYTSAIGLALSGLNSKEL